MPNESRTIHRRYSNVRIGSVLDCSARGGFGNTSRTAQAASRRAGEVLCGTSTAVNTFTSGSTAKIATAPQKGRLLARERILCATGLLHRCPISIPVDPRFTQKSSKPQSFPTHQFSNASTLRATTQTSPRKSKTGRLKAQTGLLEQRV